MGLRRGRGLLRRGWLLLLVAAAASALGLGWTRVDADRTPPAQQPMSTVPVETAVVEPQSIEITRTGLGTVVAWNTATITPQVSGEVIDLPFHEGETVQKGDVIVRIDPRPFQATLDQATSKKAQDEANLVAIQKNLSRDQTLLSKGGFAATQQMVDNERAQVDALKSAIVGDQAAIESAQLNLDFATIRAPFTGVMGLRNVDLGNVVTTASSIVTITQIEPIAVDFALPQADLGIVQAAASEGSPQVVALDQNGKNALGHGTLDAINNRVDSASGTIKLKARFDNTDHKLWPGDFVQVRVVVRIEPNAIAVPSQAVQDGPDGPYIWLASADKTVRVQAIKIGDIQDGRTVVASGLTAGDRIVVTGQYRLTPGARVTETSPQPTNGRESGS